MDSEGAKAPPPVSAPLPRFCAPPRSHAPFPHNGGRHVGGTPVPVPIPAPLCTCRSCLQTGSERGGASLGLHAAPSLHAPLCRNGGGRQKGGCPFLHGLPFM